MTNREKHRLISTIIIVAIGLILTAAISAFALRNGKIDIGHPAQEKVEVQFQASGK